MSDETKRRAGRPRGEPAEPYRVMLSTDDAEWAKSGPEGLSGLLRRLLAAERRRQLSSHEEHAKSTARREQP